MINLIDGGKTETCPVEQKGIGYYNDEITKSLKDISTFLFSESGSDIFKELTYSRNLTNLCSLESESYGEKIKLFPCERVQDELVPPELKSTSAGKTVDSYCYGKFLGKYFTKENLTDNWFCCEVYNTK